jgi:hypothetical protein
MEYDGSILVVVWRSEEAVLAGFSRRSYILRGISIFAGCHAESRDTALGRELERKVTVVPVS